MTCSKCRQNFTGAMRVKNIVFFSEKIRVGKDYQVVIQEMNPKLDNYPEKALVCFTINFQWKMLNFIFSSLFGRRHVKFLRVSLKNISRWPKSAMATTQNRHLACFSGTNTISKKRSLTSPTSPLFPTNGQRRTKFYSSRHFSSTASASFASDRWWVDRTLLNDYNKWKYF